MKRRLTLYALIGALAMLCGSAHAQGVLAPGYVMGNGTATNPYAVGPYPLSSIMDQALCGTNGDVPLRGASVWGCGVPPSGFYGTVTANKVLAGPTSGSAAAPGFRALVGADLPANINAVAFSINGTSVNTSVSTTQYAAVKIDNATITLNGSNQLQASGAAATTITPGTTTIGGATAPCAIVNSTGTTMACVAGAAVNTTDGDFKPSTQSTFTMGGYAFSVTPTRSGNVKVTINGTIGDTGGGGNVGDGIAYKINWGTGTAPTLNAAVTGTTCSVTHTYQNAVTISAAYLFSPFSISCVVTGLTPSTAYWFDLAGAQQSANINFKLIGVGFSAIEN